MARQRGPWRPGDGRLPASALAARSLLAVALLTQTRAAAGAAPGAAGDDPGSAVAKAAWLHLEAVARSSRATSARKLGPGDEVDWEKVHARLVAAHPHPEASGALAWLLLFGVPDSRGGLELPSGFPRDVDRAVAVAREGAGLRSPTCGRCYSLLAFLLSIGYPPLVNAAHATRDSAGGPLLIFVGEGVKARPFGSADAAKLPRDIGRPDPVASAYSIAARSGDAVGVMATTHLGRHGILDTQSYKAPMANQASAAIPRRPSDGEAATCDPFLTALLGELAGEAVDALQTMEAWGPAPQPLAAAKGPQKDRAWLQHVMTNPKEASPAEVAEVADMLETGGVASGDVPSGGGGPSTPTELRKIAAERGSPHAALRVALDHLQNNETEEARPLLERAVATAQDASDAEMAQYYMRRYTDETPDSGAAWTHLVRAAELGRTDAELLVAHAEASGGEVAGAPKQERNASEAMRRYRHIAQGAEAGGLSEVQSFAAYNLGVLSMKGTAPRQADARGSSAGPGAGSAGPGGGGGGHGGAGKPKESGSGKKGDAASRSKPSADAGSPAPAVDAINNASGNASNGSRPALGNASSPEIAANDTLALPGGQEEAEEEDSAPSCTPEAQLAFQEVVLSRLPLVRMTLALAQRAAKLGDAVGGLLLSSLLSDLGHTVGHADAAYLWDGWARRRPPHLGAGKWESEQGAAAQRSTDPCELAGWWTTSSESLAEQNVSRVFVSTVEGGGFEMFNASVEAGAQGLEGIEMPEVVFPQPTRSQFRHLHSFLWHTTYDVLPDGAPVPVALQPPGAVPHLVEHHHQRGKLLLDESCSTARVEGMYVNWTFHRLGAPRATENQDASADSGGADCDEADGTGRCGVDGATSGVEVSMDGARDFLHCWSRPAWYFLALEASLAAAKPPPAPPPGSWEAMMALTGSDDCPCHGAFACRGSSGACTAVAAPGDTCPPGSRHCPEVDPKLEPNGKPFFAAAPEVCALAYHGRAAVAGSVDAMHVLSHAYSNGLRGAPKDAAEALAWSRRAMDAGDSRGRFDVAYSLEFGLGTEADPARAHAIYKELLQAQNAEVPLAAKASSFMALLAASGRYLAGRLLGGSAGETPRAPWAA